MFFLKQLLWNFMRSMTVRLDEIWYLSQLKVTISIAIHGMKIIHFDRISQ